eukprot:TRINITY_DN2385_c0_g1_i1.p1 TRINITY_DN2385_c0_g1~~TRINITY_DN2385_c0_g1_i1.p1  ORF type:complete len:996 (+),score=324.08 TRINITY_DN2385_c0_g1_i1:74-3061(+)
MCIRDRAVLMIFLVYPGLSQTLCRTFVCKDINDSDWLAADYSLRCYTEDWTSYAMAALFGIVLVTIGVPIFLYSLLSRNRQKLRISSKFMDRYGLLYSRFEPSFFWFECVEMLRKVSLLCLPLFVAPGTMKQVALCLVLSIGFMCLHVKFTPFEDEIDDHLQTICCVATLLTFSCAALLMSEEDGMYVSVILLLSNGAVVVYFLYSFVFDTLPMFSRLVALNRVSSEDMAVKDGNETDTEELKLTQKLCRACNMCDSRVGNPLLVCSLCHDFVHLKCSDEALQLKPGRWVCGCEERIGHAFDKMTTIASGVKRNMGTFKEFDHSDHDGAQAGGSRAPTIEVLKRELDAPGEGGAPRTEGMVDAEALMAATAAVYGVSPVHEDSDSSDSEPCESGRQPRSTREHVLRLDSLPIREGKLSRREAEAALDELWEHHRLGFLSGVEFRAKQHVVMLRCTEKFHWPAVAEPEVLSTVLDQGDKDFLSNAEAVSEPPNHDPASEQTAEVVSVSTEGHCPRESEDTKQENRKQAPVRVAPARFPAREMLEAAKQMQSVHAELAASVFNEPKPADTPIEVLEAQGSKETLVSASESWVLDVDGIQASHTSSAPAEDAAAQEGAAEEDAPTQEDAAAVQESAGVDPAEAAAPEVVAAAEEAPTEAAAVQEDAEGEAAPEAVAAAEEALAEAAAVEPLPVVAVAAAAAAAESCVLDVLAATQKVEIVVVPEDAGVDAAPTEAEAPAPGATPAAEEAPVEAAAVQEDASMEVAPEAATVDATAKNRTQDEPQDVPQQLSKGEARRALIELRQQRHNGELSEARYRELKLELQSTYKAKKPRVKPVPEPQPTGLQEPEPEEAVAPEEALEEVAQKEVQVAQTEPEATTQEEGAAAQGEATQQAEAAQEEVAPGEVVQKADSLELQPHHQQAACGEALLEAVPQAATPASDKSTPQQERLSKHAAQALLEALRVRRDAGELSKEEYKAEKSKIAKRCRAREHSNVLQI